MTSDWDHCIEASALSLLRLYLPADPKPLFGRCIQPDLGLDKVFQTVLCLAVASRNQSIRRVTILKLACKAMLMGQSSKQVDLNFGHPQGALQLVKPSWTCAVRVAAL